MPAIGTIIGLVDLAFKLIGAGAHAYEAYGELKALVAQLRATPGIIPDDVAARWDARLADINQQAKAAYSKWLEDGQEIVGDATPKV